VGIIKSYYSVCVKHGVFKFSRKWYINLPLDPQKVLEEKFPVAGCTKKQFCNEKKY
jgi:hypothetical protein